MIFILKTTNTASTKSLKVGKNLEEPQVDAIQHERRQKRT